MQPNPYEPPGISATSILTSPRETSGTGLDLLRDWERRRLWFNGILVALTLLMGVCLNLFLERRFWELAGEGALAVNVCFCTGPVATWYLTQLGVNPRIAGIGLYWVGTAFSILLATALLFGNFVSKLD